MKWTQRLCAVATLGFCLIGFQGCAENNEDRIKKEMAGKETKADTTPPPKVEKLTPPAGYPSKK